MVDIVNKIKRVEFVGDFSDSEKLAVETCPGFNVALEKAKTSYYETKICQECNVCEVSYDPNLKKISIKGKCPKK